MSEELAHLDASPPQEWADEMIAFDNVTVPKQQKDDNHEVIDTTTASKVYQKYLQWGRKDKKRIAEHNNREIRYKDKVMKYGMKIIGKKDDNNGELLSLYIALHGGGGCPACVNDQQWRSMQRYYLGSSSIKRGIYVAPRGITNTWNLHFVPESYIMYDRLIENMILFEGVEPNRVYILGFSAGGDGIYQITPRMADRWAAANMSAGHHNHVNPRNLYHVPFLVQVGAHDKAYNRHYETVNFGEKLIQLQHQEKGGYPHQINVHFKKGHTFYDNHPMEQAQKIMANPFQWKNMGESEVKEENTNAIRWLSAHTRDPLPKRVIWDLNTTADRSAPELWKNHARGYRHYWLGLDTKVNGEIIASYDKDTNSIKVEKAVNGMIIFLNRHMLDLNQQVGFEMIDGTAIMFEPESTLQNLTLTAMERGDVNYMFEAAVIIVERDGEWIIDNRKV